MRLEISEYENEASLRAAATFIIALADIQRDTPAIDSPFAEAPAAVIVEQSTDESPPVVLGTLRDDNTPLADTPAVEPSVPLGDNTPAPVGELDSAGFPWDERICSSGKTKKADGTWVARRGVDKAIIENVKAEFLAIAAVTPAVAAVDPGADAAQAAAVFGGQAAPVNNVTPITDAQPQTWPEVMQVIVAKQNAGTLNQEVLNNFMAQNQVQAFPLLANRPDLYPALLQAVL